MSINDFRSPPTLIFVTRQGVRALDSCAIVWRVPSKSAFAMILVSHHQGVQERLASQPELAAFEDGGMFTSTMKKAVVLDWLLAPDNERRTVICHCSEAKGLIDQIIDGNYDVTRYGVTKWERNDDGRQ